MTKNEVLNLKPSLVKSCDDELFHLIFPITDLISEEKKPSLYSLSLTESICSDSTMDLNVDACYHLPSSLESTIDSVKPIIENREHCSGSLIETSGSTRSEFRKCLSLHDVSNMIHSQIDPKSVNAVSCETIHSQSLSSTTKSKDSGFHRSTSCLSLTSGKRNYDHVESKVKAYIKNIKETEALRKKNKLKQKCEELNNPELIIPDHERDIILNKEDLLTKIDELKQELHEKSLYIDAQQKSYNSLLLKFAEAKNTIDTLRLQRLSLDYTSLNESREVSSRNKNVNFDLFIQDKNNKSNNSELFEIFRFQELNNLKGKSSKQEHLSLSSSFSNNSQVEFFEPKKHSTPDRSKPCLPKCLSPITKLCSGSSRLDKQCKPLINIQNNIYCGTKATEPQPESSSQKSKLSSRLMTRKINLKKATNPKQQKLSNHIDLPNDDPFDKVKKWQASLPNINLLGTQSSSDHEEYKEEEEEINSLLSQELVTKCKISEMKVVSSQVVQNVTEHVERKKPLTIDNKQHMESHSQVDVGNSNHVGQQDNIQSNKSVKKFKDVQHSKIKTSTSDEVFSESKPLIEVISQNCCTSEDESHSYIPRSSSVSHRSYKNARSSVSDNDSSDDDSSVSSSVLSCSLPSKNTKRKHMHNKSNTLSKIKIDSKKRINSNFVLRKPTLNVSMLDENIANNDKSAHIPLSSNSNSSSQSPLNLKTESSQRKAWNERNNTNFYVCQDFYYKKSSNLLNCITVMEGMVNMSFPIIDTVLERSNSK